MIFNKRQTRIRFSLILILCFLGGVCISKYSWFGLWISEPATNKGVGQKNPVGNAAVALAGSNLESRRIAALTKTMQHARDIGLSLNAPMEFFGRVVDQDGKPVPGVSVNLDYIYYNAIVLATYEPHKGQETRLSDQNGDFSFTGKVGVTLTVTLEPMPGIRFGRGGYWSHSFQSDKQSGVSVQPTTKQSPYVFPAFRLGQSAQLKLGFLEAFLQPDGRAYQINLSQDKVSEEGVGDLEVSVWQKGTYGKSGTSWGIKVNAVSNIELQSTDDPFLYRAPSGSYQREWTSSRADGDHEYGRDRDFKFWVKQGDYYGSLSLECVAFFKDKFRLIVRSSINQKPGDTNLQPVLPDWPPKATTTKK